MCIVRIRKALQWLERISQAFHWRLPTCLKIYKGSKRDSWADKECAMYGCTSEVQERSFSWSGRPWREMVSLKFVPRTLVLPSFLLWTRLSQTLRQLHPVQTESDNPTLKSDIRSSSIPWRSLSLLLSHRILRAGLACWECCFLLEKSATRYCLRVARMPRTCKTCHVPKTFRKQILCNVVLLRWRRCVCVFLFWHIWRPLSLSEG